MSVGLASVEPSVPAFVAGDGSFERVFRRGGLRTVRSACDGLKLPKRARFGQHEAIAQGREGEWAPSSESRQRVDRGVSRDPPSRDRERQLARAGLAGDAWAILVRNRSSPEDLSDVRTQRGAREERDRVAVFTETGRDNAMLARLDSWLSQRPVAGPSAVWLGVTPSPGVHSGSSGSVIPVIRRVRRPVPAIVATGSTALIHRVLARKKQCLCGCVWRHPCNGRAVGADRGGTIGACSWFPRSFAGSMSLRSRRSSSWPAGRVQTAVRRSVHPTVGQVGVQFGRAKHDIASIGADGGVRPHFGPGSAPGSGADCASA